jgi:hypothetical protein
VNVSLHLQLVGLSLRGELGDQVGLGELDSEILRHCDMCGVARFEQLAGKEKIELDLTGGRGTWLAAGWVMSGVEAANTE